ncbi:unnamed protein product [Ectocarpus sp. 6 AP-2014]
MPSSPRPSSASPPSTTAPSTSAPAAPVTPPAIATSARRPGRPRKSYPASREPSWIYPTTGDIAADIIDSGVGAPHDFSVTIGNRSGANMKESLFNEGCAWMTKRAVRGVTSMERGDMNGNLHLQGIWALSLKDVGDSKKEEVASRRKLRVDCGWTAADKDHHQAPRQAKRHSAVGMVGYCSKDEGRSHFKTVTKGVSGTEVNIARAEYRTLQQSVVSELRSQQEHLRGISVSPVQLISWDINDGEGMPSHTWICPTSAFAMEAARADAYFTALISPSLFTRKGRLLALLLRRAGRARELVLREVGLPGPRVLRDDGRPGEGVLPRPPWTSPASTSCATLRSLIAPRRRLPLVVSGTASAVLRRTRRRHRRTCR